MCKDLEAMNAEEGFPGLGDKDSANKLISPLRTLTVVTVVIFMAETVIMTAFHFLPPFGELTGVLIDAFSLVILVFPALYFLIFRPFLLSVKHREIWSGRSCASPRYRKTIQTQ